MRVLVAGASGPLGTSLIYQLSHRGHEVIGLTPERGEVLKLGTRGVSWASVSEIVADPAVRLDVLSAVQNERVDAVIDVLGTTGQYGDDYKRMTGTNRARAEGTSTMLAAAANLGVSRYVSASSYYGYGFKDHGETPLAESAPFGEDDKTSAANTDVLRALRSSERQVRAADGISLRLGHVYSTGANAVPPVSRKWQGSLPVVHVDDAAHALILALSDGTPGASYNIANDTPATWRQLQEFQARADGYASPVALTDGVLRKIAPFASQVITKT
ncbi:MAG: hypothetical protein JWQ43_4181, partial [Glaciihabitans sp.]|nr:hypothetical protein [Glaciihabitans sp.]